MTEVVNHRWNGVAQTEDALRHYFESSPLDMALETYSVMRKQYELAGKVIDQRVQDERNEERCENCKKKFDQVNVWYNRESVKDPVTGTVRNVFSCSQACMIAIKGKGRKPRP